MENIGVTQVFSAYAAYYDLLYSEKPYDEETAYIERMILKYRQDATTILELGSGTGRHAASFAASGFHTHGVERSHEMLHQAERRRRGLPEEVSAKMKFQQGDIRTFRSEASGEYDVVLSLFHVFSYLLTNEDIESAFLTAHAHLKTGGLLVFDYWYGPAVLSQRPSVRIKRMENDELSFVRIAEPTIFFDENRVQVDYTIYARQKRTGAQEEIQETHNMRYLFLPEVALLARGKFKILSNLAWMKQSDASPDDWAAVCVLEKV